MKTRLILLIFSILLSTSSYSQINERALFNTIAEEDAERVEPEQVSTNHLDSLLSIWYIQKALQDTTGIILFDEEKLPPADMPDSVYIRRLMAMPSIISLPYNDIVKKYIVYYMQKIPNQLEMILGLSEYYLPIFEEILDSYDIPLEMKALPIIESALNPVAVSRAGATGMWQFMLRTGRYYGLTINTYVDERRDPIASAHAAAQYLNALYDRFNDWTLALAAYNCGEGNVEKAIKRADGKKDYWEIYPYLPKETRNYVPLFVAANYAITYYKEHMLTPRGIALPVDIDTFMVNTKLHFGQITNTIGIPIDELRDLNPQYKRDVIPGNERAYELRIPSDYTDAFIESERKIFENDSKYFNKNIVVNPNTGNGKSTATASKQNTQTQAQNNVKAQNSEEENRQRTIHQVKAGESLGLIAQKNGVNLNDLCYWNNLKNNTTIFPGQKLIIYKSGGAPTATGETQKKSSEKRYHTVKNGESLWAISQKYSDVTFYDLLKVNNMTDKSKIVPGQKILLP